MSTTIMLFETGAMRLIATDAELRTSFVGRSVPDEDSRSASLRDDLRRLAEQGLVVADGDAYRMEWGDWSLALDLDARSLTAFSAPCHFLLEIDRISELGRPDFRYVMRWREGSREVEIERAGAYVRHAASGRVMHLDARTLALVEAMDRFNRLTPDERRVMGTAWASLAEVHRNVAESGAILDGYLKSNTVLIPSTIGLTIHEDEHGAVTFLPRLPEFPESAAFSAAFDQSLTVSDVSTVTDANGRRIRILFSEAQKQVLERMKAVRRLKGEQARSLRAAPEAVFDGVAEAIDLSDITLEYGPRVIGIGPLARQPNIRPEGGPSIVDRMFGPDRTLSPDGEAPAPGGGTPEPIPGPVEPDKASAPPPEAEPRRSAVAIDVLDGESGEVATIRLPDEEAIKSLRDAVRVALDRGDTHVVHQGRTIRVEPELAEVLERHLSTVPEPRGGAGDDGRLGASGHLYLLINEHEDSLTPELLVNAGPTGLVVDAPFTRPAALAPTLALQEHQVHGLRWLATCRGIPQRRGAVLADDMGLGKTLQLLTHIASLIESGALAEQPGAGRNGPWRPVLIVAPLLLVESGTWTEEMRRHFADGGAVFEPWLVLRDEGLRKVRREGSDRDHLGKPLLDPARIMAHKVVITTYETLMGYQHSLAQRVDGRPLWSLAIFDEAQEVKSPTAKQSYAAKALDAGFKVAATGTPVETRLRDLWNLLDTVEPTLLGTQREFVATYERPAMNASSPEERRAALDALRARLRYQQPGAVLLRRDKSILHRMPARLEHRRRYEMTAEERETVGRIVAGMRGDARRHALNGLQELHLASQHPDLIGGGRELPAVDALIRRSGRLKETIAILREVELRGEKAIIFARSVPAQRLLARVLSRTFTCEVDVVNGHTGVTDATRARNAGSVRRAILDRYRNTPGFAVIVLSPFVAGVGITLVEANHVIHYGRWWNPAIEAQATDRAYRIGQTKDVHVYYPIAVDPSGGGGRTFDEALDTLLSERRELARDFLVPVGEDALADSLFDRLIDEAPMEHVAVGVRSVEEVASCLGAVCTSRDERFAWLGRDGRFGVQALVRSGFDVRVYRLVDSYDGSDAQLLLAGADSWSAALGCAVSPGKVVSIATPGGGGEWSAHAEPWLRTLAGGRAISMPGTHTLAVVRSASDAARLLGL